MVEVGVGVGVFAGEDVGFWVATGVADGVSTCDRSSVTGFPLLDTGFVVGVFVVEAGGGLGVGTVREGVGAVADELRTGRFVGSSSPGRSRSSPSVGMTVSPWSPCLEPDPWKDVESKPWNGADHE